MAEGNDPGEVTVSFAPEEDGVGPLEDGATTKALVRLSRAAAAMGFRDAVHLFDEVDGRVGADSTAWLLHPRRAGRSFAVPRDESGLDGVGVAVCYPREASFPEKLTGTARVDPVTVVHELLHLFGAADKYGQPLSAFAPRTVTAREVMRLSHTRLTRLRIDAATAREIGWNTSGYRTTAAPDWSSPARPSVCDRSKPRDGGGNSPTPTGRVSSTRPKADLSRAG